MKWWCNGNLIEPTRFGEFEGGVFETFRTFGGEFWRLDEHWERWHKSGEILDIKTKLSFEDLKQALQELILVNSTENLELRFKLWTDGKDTWIKVGKLDLEDVSGGVVVSDAVFERANSQAKYGAHFYPDFRQQCVDQGLFEIIWFDADNYLLEGSITNVFAVIDGQLVTPKSDRVLPGLMRQFVGGQERDILKSDLQGASEIFLTNMIRGVVPVRRWGSWESHDFSRADSLQEKLANLEGVFRMSGYNF